MDRSSPAVKLIEYWQSRGIPFCRPESDAEFVQFKERRRFLNLPTDLQEYFQLANGTGLYPPSDDDSIDFWPLWMFAQFILTEDLYVFADYLAGIFWFAIDLSHRSESNGKIYRISGRGIDHALVASSFADFVTKYIENRHELFE